MQLPELNRDEYETLLFMCCYAVGAAHEKRESVIATGFLRLTNKLCENDPEFIPYVLPEDTEKV